MPNLDNRTIYFLPWEGKGIPSITQPKQQGDSNDRQHSSEKTSYLTIQGPPAAAGAAAAATVETAPGGAAVTLAVPDSHPSCVGVCQMWWGHMT